MRAITFAILCLAWTVLALIVYDNQRGINFVCSAITISMVIAIICAILGI